MPDRFKSKNDTIMKHSFFILILVLFAQFQLVAQDGFVVKAPAPHVCNVPEDMLIAPDGTIFFIFSSMPPSPSLTFTNEIYKINPFGEIVDSHAYTDTVTGEVEYLHCLLVEDTVYVFGWGFQTDEVNNIRTFLLMQTFDLQLSLISTHQIQLDQIFPYISLHGRVVYHGSSFHYISSYYVSGNTQMPFKAEVSKSGQLINFKIEGEEGKVIIPYDFMIDENGGFKVFSLAAGLNGSAVLCGIQCKYNQNFEFEKYFLLPETFINFFTHEAINDSISYLSGQWLKMSAWDFWRAGILKLKNDTIVTHQLLYSSYPDSAACPAYRHSLEVLPDENLIFCFNGDIEYHMIPQSYPAKINLMKLTPNLEVIWHRYIGDPGFKYEAWEMHTTATGEIVILGAMSLAPPLVLTALDAMIIKTNSEGLVTGTNDEFPGVHSSQAFLYPNPSSDELFVEFSMAYSEATFRLMDIKGRNVYEKQLTLNRQSINIKAVPPGLYVYQIYNARGMDERGKLIVE